MKADPEAYEVLKKRERDRYTNRVLEGKIKLLADMSDREKSCKEEEKGLRSKTLL